MSHHISGLALSPTSDASKKRTWNQQEPFDDRERLLDKFAHVFEHGGHSSDKARELAGNLHPDFPYLGSPR